MLLDRAGIAVSMGSACSTGSFEPSHVLVAMKVADNAVRGGVRFSLSRDNTDADVDRALEVIPDVIARLREISPFGAEEGAPAALNQAHV
jgi:cysteine desulfurase